MSIENNYLKETVKISDLLVTEKRSTSKLAIVFIICFLSTLFGGVIIYAYVGLLTGSSKRFIG